MSVAVKRISDVIEALAASPEGATSQEIAARLNMGRQAASRLLEAMLGYGLAERDAASRRYRLGLRIFRWGSSAAARFGPPPFLRYEVALLAEDVLHPVFYSVLGGETVTTIERTQQRGRHTLTTPDFRENPWHATSSGRALAAFQPPSVTEALLSKLPARERPALEEDLESVRLQGFAASEAVRVEGYTLAAPVLDAAGHASAALGIGVNKLVADERDVITRRLLETAARVSATAGYGSVLLNA